MRYIYIDFETYSEADLKSVGAHRYATDPTTEVLMLCYDGDLWDATVDSRIPDDLQLLLEDDEVIFCAFNAQFERLIFKHVLGINIPVTRFICTMVKAYALGFTGTLGQVQAQIGFRPEQSKLATGRKLIQRFCKPQPKNHNVRRWTRHNDPEGWTRFKEYCMQDVVAEIELDLWVHKYHPMSSTEWELYQLDQKINDAGVPINVEYAKNALALHQKAKHIIKQKLALVTGLPNPLAPSQMRAWLDERGVHLPNMQAATLAVADAGDYQYILDEYSQAVATAPTKYKAFLKCNVNGRVHGMFQFRGAQRTARWAGRIVQLQNLKRGNIDAATADAIEAGCLDCISLVGEPTEILAMGVRSTITAPEGRLLNVSDLSSIESRGLGWITNCDRINQIFAEGKDTYKDFATELFQVPYDQVTKEQRTFAKPPVLGAGYGLGAKGMMAYAKGMGVVMSEDQAETAVYTFRDTYEEVTDFWGFVMRAIEALLTRGEALRTRLLSFTISPDKQFLWITLPSGRRLAYYQPLWQEWDTPIGLRMSFTYMGTNRFTTRWERIAAHHGLVTENIVQAIARDILAVWMMRADRAGFDLRLHVHDELASVETRDRVEELNNLIKQPIPWAPGLLLDAEGYTAKRYRK